MSSDQMYEYSLPRLSASEMRKQGHEFLGNISRRRSIRDFSPEPVPSEAIELAIRAAMSAPSGANQQPWFFVAISQPEKKKEIRIAAEAEEREFYEGGRMSEPWRRALEPIGTNWQKPFLETAPWLVVVFAQNTRNDMGREVPNYYVKESVGIACGFFILALHAMGLFTLTHTPSPMAFLNTILNRPTNEKPYILFPVGYPAADARVPNLPRKSLAEAAMWLQD